MTPRRTGLIALLCASAVSNTGSLVSMVVVPWLVLVTTGSAAQTGLVAFAEMLPYVLLQAFAAPLVDRLGSRRVSVACDIVSALIALTIPLLYDHGHLAFWELCLLVAVLGAARGPGENAKQVIVPEVVADARVPTERGAGLLDGVMRLGTLMGAPLGGALAGTVGAANAIVVDAASFAVAAALVLALVPARSRPHAERLTYLRDLRAGLSFLGADPLLRAIALMVLVTNLLGQAVNSVLVPVWARNAVGTATAVGLVFGAFGLGALLGNLTFSAISHRLPRRLTFAICFMVAGAPRLVVLALTSSLPLVTVVSAAGGFAAGAINPLVGAASYERIPRALQARVLGAVGATAWAGIPLGALVGGWMVASVGLTPALLAAAAAYFLTTVLPFVLPAWRLMDREHTCRPPR